MKVNPIGQYILDEQGNPILELDPHRWSEWCFSDGGVERRRVAETYIPYQDIRRYRDLEKYMEEYTAWVDEVINHLYGSEDASKGE